MSSQNRIEALHAAVSIMAHVPESNKTKLVAQTLSLAKAFEDYIATGDVPTSHDLNIEMVFRGFRSGHHDNQNPRVRSLHAANAANA